MLNTNLSQLSARFRISRGMLFGGLIITALLAFEFFNYSTTDFALTDLLGELQFLGVRWATILSIAFCGIDFAGIARLFTPEQGRDEPAEVWYLFGAWMLAATMNAMLTWWGVSIAILNHETLGNAVVARATLLKVVPIFVAVMVWLIRVLIIGTISVAGDRLFSQQEKGAGRSSQKASSQSTRSSQRGQTGYSRKPAQAFAPRSMPSGVQRGMSGQNSATRNSASPYRSVSRPEPTYEADESGYPGAQDPVYTPVSFNGQRSDNGRKQTRF